MMRMLEHCEPEVGDRELARGAQQESFAELCFKGSDPSRNGGLGQAQALRGSRKAAFVDDTGEKEKVVGLEVHFRCVRRKRSRKSRRAAIRGEPYCCWNGTIIPILMASDPPLQQIH